MNELRGLWNALVTFLALVGAITIFFFVTCLATVATH
jgi:hypothetical protein